MVKTRPTHPSCRDSAGLLALRYMDRTRSEKRIEINRKKDNGWTLMVSEAADTPSTFKWRQNSGRSHERRQLRVGKQQTTQQSGIRNIALGQPVNRQLADLARKCKLTVDRPNR
ncbi:hypothetical protein HZH68_000641 [Vespula germanica]|uniref:Uncharacterized protein n=1 Tax=Vespula germanica TaxID=30212 RepID=A0A834NU56_VESGE|nr:hypothetical protein HZH68_000641 [Vespula germanica]